MSLKGILKRAPYCMIALAAILAASAATLKSVTIDEFQDVTVGLEILKSGYFPIINPPLCSVLPALPLLFTKAKLDVQKFKNAKDVWEVGDRFQYENAESLHFYFVLGRMVNVLVFSVCCFLTYLLSQSIYGPLAGLLGTAFSCLNPHLTGPRCSINSRHLCINSDHWLYICVRLFLAKAW